MVRISASRISRIFFAVGRFEVPPEATRQPLIEGSFCLWVRHALEGFWRPHFFYGRQSPPHGV
jgi:hypothetical protein